MPAAGIVTLIAITLAILALAGYLLHVIWLLHRTSFTLGTIIAGLRAIAHQTQPIEAMLHDVNADLAAAQKALEGVLGTELQGRYGEREKRELSVWNSGPAAVGLDIDDPARSG